MVFPNRRSKPQNLITGSVVISLLSFGLATAAEAPLPPQTDPITGPRTRRVGRWIGHEKVSKDVQFLILAGHADSQGMQGSGTSGAAVDLQGADPMDPRMRDELFWNLKIRDAVVREGLIRGLNIRSYDPGNLSIPDDNDPRTNWSVARRQSALGDYVLEIHFDAYSPHGYGSGLIPALNRKLNRVDESLALEFGRYPKLFRGGLGGPRRGLGILEIGMLGGNLEAKLRNPNTRKATIDGIAQRVAEALVRGITTDPPKKIQVNYPPWK